MLNSEKSQDRFHHDKARMNRSQNSNTLTHDIASTSLIHVIREKKERENKAAQIHNRIIYL